MNKDSQLRVRFAPSPTGYLHIGGARTCLFNWLYARKLSGQFILRIEDTDLERSKKEYLDEILESIKWLGMNWDDIFYQSKRFDIHREYAEKLISSGKAYRKEGAVFFKCDFESIEIDDLVRGKIIFKELPKKEEVIIKSDNSPAYNFSCVIDDALMKINCVIRGEDHISNTPKQVLMYQALGFEVPKFAHVPLILSPGGGRLSKRFGATSIREYKQAGYLSEAIVNYLLLLGWSPGNNREIISLDEAKDIFDIAKVNKTGAVFSIDKLKWVNAEYIRGKTLAEFISLARQYLEENNCLPPDVDNDYLEKVLNLFKERVYTLADLKDWIGFCFAKEIQYAPETENILENNLSKEMKLLIERFKAVDDFKSENVESEFRKVAEELGVKAKILVHPSRVALTGKKIGPGLFETMEVLGKDKVIERLQKLVNHWGGEHV
ncbi:MAG: glutamate--tRNA ligase [Candidatus Omnitrophica bacterium]|nr:glutamate--tRNA ligase [Candidatus Omnitrophota bacterium]MDD5429880.1 glutamate--tRNA ligase [Candidatus Omnitrophota bacterium]